MTKLFLKCSVFCCSVCLGFGSLHLIAGGQNDAARIPIAKSDIFTFGELAQLVRTHARRDFYIDRRHHQRRLFVSKGSYDFMEILKALKVGSAMVLRRPESVWFMTGSNAKYGQKLEFPILSTKTLGRLQKKFNSWALQTDFAKVPSPLPVRDFLDRATIPFEKMSKEQKEFLLEVLKDSFPEDPAEFEILHKSLTQSKIRLGSSYLIISSRIALPVVADRPLERSFFQGSQVYYDYHDRWKESDPRQP